MPRTSKTSELLDVSLKILHETEKAYLVSEGLHDEEGKEKTTWLPKSQVQLDPDSDRSKVVTVTMPRWLFEEKGFTPDD